MDGTLLEAWASTKSFRPKDGSGPPADAGRNGEQDFRGQKRTNETHASANDLDAGLYREGRGKEAKLCFMGHALMENRGRLIVGAVATRASGHAKRLAAVAFITPHAERPEPITPGAEKAYDAPGLQPRLNLHGRPLTRRTSALASAGPLLTPAAARTRR